MKKTLNGYFGIFAVSIILGLMLKSNLTLPISLMKHNPDFSILFGTIATILSSIFALMFVVLTLSIQISDKYSAFDIFVNKETKLLMGTYFFTIISALFMIQYGYYFPVFMFTMATFCILSLYPFLRNINNKILFDIGTHNLGEEIAEFIDSRKEASAKNKINELGYLGKKAVGNNSYSIVENIVEILQINFIMALKATECRLYLDSFGTQYIKMLSSTNKKTDPKIISALFDHIHGYVNSCGATVVPEILFQQQRQIKDIALHWIEEKNSKKYITETIILIYMGIHKSNHLLKIKNENPVVFLEEIAEKSKAKSLVECLEYSVTALWYSAYKYYDLIIRKSSIEDTSSNHNSKDIENLKNDLSIALKCLLNLEAIIDDCILDSIYEKRGKSSDYFDETATLFFRKEIPDFSSIRKQLLDYHRTELNK